MGMMATASPDCHHRELMAWSKAGASGGSSAQVKKGDKSLRRCDPHNLGVGPTIEAFQLKVRWEEGCCWQLEGFVGRKWRRAAGGSALKVTCFGLRSAMMLSLNALHESQLM